MFKLVIEDDEGNKTVVPLIRDEITIGRQDGNTIRLTERNVSRKHARLVKEDEGDVFLEEVSARYGTRKNGERIDGRTDFNLGDVFTIGDYRLTLQSEVAADAKKPEDSKPSKKKANGAAAPAAGGFSNQPTQITSLEESTDAPAEGTEVLPADPAKLVIVSSNFAGQEFPLARKEMVIGRGEECDIIIDHRSVSQKHAKVVRESGGEYKIIDLKSKNGVKVGGEEYRAVHLKRGDIVELGHVKFRFVEPGENYEFTPAAPEEDFAPASSKMPLMALIGVVLLVAAVVGGFMFVGDASSDASSNGSASKTDPGGASPGDRTATAGSDATLEEFEKARSKYESGDANAAIVHLEILRDREDLSPELVEDVDDLLSKAKREKSLQPFYESGVVQFNKGRWLEALEDFNEIPPDDELRMYQLIGENDYKTRAIRKIQENAIEIANSSTENPDFDAARKGPEAALDLLHSHKGLEATLDQIESMRKKKVAKPIAAVRPPRKPKPEKPEKPVKESKPGKEKDPSQIDPLWRKAFKLSAKGKHSEAIAKAKESIFHGCGVKCYRVLAITYKNKGDSSNACRYHKKAGIEIPPELNCE